MLHQQPLPKQNQLAQESLVQGCCSAFGSYSRTSSCTPLLAKDSPVSKVSVSLSQLGTRNPHKGTLGHPVFHARVKRFLSRNPIMDCPHLRSWWSQTIPPKLEPELPKKTVSNAWHWVNIPSIIPTKFVGKVCLDHHPFSNNNRYITNIHVYLEPKSPLF